MKIVCWQTILVKYHTLIFRRFGKILKNLSSAAVVIGALRVMPQLNKPTAVSLSRCPWSKREGTQKLYPAVEYAQKYLVKWALRISPEQRICFLPLKKIFTWVILANLQPHRLGW